MAGLGAVVSSSCGLTVSCLAVLETRDRSVFFFGPLHGRREARMLMGICGVRHASEHTEPGQNRSSTKYTSLAFRVVAANDTGKKPTALSS